MFGRKSKREKKAEKKEAYRREVRKGLLFWLPGGSTRLDIYLDYCVLHALGRTKLKEKSRVIPFNDIIKVVYTPATTVRHACLQLFTKDIAQKVIEFLRNPNGSNVVPPDYLNQLKKERRRELRAEAEAAKAQETSPAGEQEAV